MNKMMKVHASLFSGFGAANLLQLGWAGIMLFGAK